MQKISWIFWRKRYNLRVGFEKMGNFLRSFLPSMCNSLASVHLFVDLNQDIIPCNTAWNGVFFLIYFLKLMAMPKAIRKVKKKIRKDKLTMESNSFIIKLSLKLQINDNGYIFSREYLLSSRRVYL